MLPGFLCRENCPSLCVITPFLSGLIKQNFDTQKNELWNNVIRFRAATGQPQRGLVQRVEVDEGDLLELTQPVLRRAVPRNAISRDAGPL